LICPNLLPLRFASDKGQRFWFWLRLRRKPGHNVRGADAVGGGNIGVNQGDIGPFQAKVAQDVLYNRGPPCPEICRTGARQDAAPRPGRNGVSRGFKRLVQADHLCFQMRKGLGAPGRVILHLCDGLGREEGAFPATLLQGKMSLQCHIADLAVDAVEQALRLPLVLGDLKKRRLCPSQNFFGRIRQDLVWRSAPGPACHRHHILVQGCNHLVSNF
jgi:hypothetical protein